MAGFLFCSKSKNKLGLGFSSIESAKIGFGWDLILLKMLKLAKIRYEWDFNLFKMLN